MTEKIIYTIGHSTHPFEQFYDLLITHNINCVIDVRSAPFSRIAPQYNKPALSSKLKAAKILYSHFGSEFGARHTDINLLDDDGKVDFEKVRKTEQFNQGIQRLHSGLDIGYRIALMCSEANPFDCHRFAMISYQLVKEGMAVRHILKDGKILDNAILEDMLIKKYFRKLPQSSLFDGEVTIRDQLEFAYKLRNKDIAYSEGDSNYKEVA
ncbi:DUF488 domain-containing protein [Candidatus Chloroploca sp. M-50]|uniref:DUF488 domain-containing protein n=1 Tax=Candidatus Chloroploca mongolica TaxID=2528176 RepID=A0ABS4DFU6_9CHLR|nr:DUF488 domain-containing protein [Candidatus Chloroploca mongolica]MBP1468302.1 DUF488 domain-containing protein [Candidatus Chloroploca mongolica]